MADLSDIPKILKRLIEQEVILEEGAKAIRRSIPRRTRAGKGVKNNGDKQTNLPKLTKTTKKIRKSLKERGELTGPGATPGKSGFNRTGDTLNNLKVEVSKKQIKVELDPKDQPKLQDALKINSDYQFMRLSASELKRVRKAIQESLNRALRKVKFNKL